MRPELTPEYLAADQSWRLLQVAVAFAILEILFVSLYVGSRLKSGVKQEADFYLIIAALIVNLGLVIVCFGKSAKYSRLDIIFTVNSSNRAAQRTRKWVD
jgi:hypothetical protein